MKKLVFMRTYKNILAHILVGLFILFALKNACADQPKIILVTGFEPFGVDTTNGSWEAVHHLNGKHIHDVTVVVAQLPVVWGEAEKTLQALIKANNPVAIISFGQAGDEPVRLETTAHNVRENILDNKNMMPPSLQIASHAAASLPTTLPLAKMETRLRAAGIPAHTSSDAGTYLCNDIFYTLIYDPGNDSAKKVPRGFVHVPPLNANVQTSVGTVIFDHLLLQKTADVIVQTLAESL